MATAPAYTKEHAFVNCKYPVYAIMTDEDANTYGTVKAIAPLMSVKPSTKTDSNTLRGDGEQQEISSDVGETTIDIEVNYNAMEFNAAVRGHAYDATTKQMTVRGTDLPPYIAMGYCLERANGKFRAYWYLKGKVDEVEDEVKQKEDKTDYSTPTVSMTFVDRSDHIRKDVKEFDTFEAAQTYLSTIPTTFVAVGTTTTTTP